MKRLTLALVFSACDSLTAAPAPAPAPVARVVVAAEPIDAGPPPMSSAEVEQVLLLNCQSCHSLAYVGQQRMTVAQWTATLTKMRGWGALLEESQLAPLANALAVSRGPSAPLPVFEARDVTAFAVEPSPAPPEGAAARGKTLFETRCLACHGPDAHGGIGVNLVDRPLLQQPSRFEAFVKSGRGRMPPHADLSPTQYGELLAFLRTL